MTNSNRSIDQKREQAAPPHSPSDSEMGMVLNRNFFKYCIHFVIVEVIPVVAPLSATMWLLLLYISYSTLYSQWLFSFCNVIGLFHFFRLGLGFYRLVLLWRMDLCSPKSGLFTAWPRAERKKSRWVTPLVKMCNDLVLHHWCRC